MKKLKLCSIISLIISGLALVTGASFHGYRAAPENAEQYELGVTVGIAMICLFAAFLAAGIILLVMYRRKNK